MSDNDHPSLADLEAIMARRLADVERSQAEGVLRVGDPIPATDPVTAHHDILVLVSEVRRLRESERTLLLVKDGIVEYR